MFTVADVPDAASRSRARLAGKSGAHGAAPTRRPGLNTKPATRFPTGRPRLANGRDLERRALAEDHGDHVAGLELLQLRLSLRSLDPWRADDFAAVGIDDLDFLRRHVSAHHHA